MATAQDLDHKEFLNAIYENALAEHNPWGNLFI